MPTVRIRTLTAALVVAGTALAVAVVPAAGSAPPLTPGMLDQLSTGPRQPVIVLLRDQGVSQRHGGGATPQAEQAPLVEQVRQTGATHVTQFDVINGFAAAVTAAERA